QPTGPAPYPPASCGHLYPPPERPPAWQPAPARFLSGGLLPHWAKAPAQQAFLPHTTPISSLHRPWRSPDLQQHMRSPYVAETATTLHFLRVCHPTPAAAPHNSSCHTARYPEYLVSKIFQALPVCSRLVSWPPGFLQLPEWSSSPPSIQTRPKLPARGQLSPPKTAG